MYYRRKIMLALLEVFPGKMDRLQFQKLLFLLNTRLETPVYHFLPYKYGCFSFQANAECIALTKQGFITTDGPTWTVNGNGSWLFSLHDTDRRTVKELAEQFGSFTTDELITYTYEQYPFYAIKSTIAYKYLDAEGMKKVTAATPRATRPALFTLGYEGLSLEEYINLLLKHDVKMLLDVRKNAQSMKYGFSKKTLQTACENVNILYEHCPDVGIVSDKRKNLQTQADYDALFAEYRATVLKQTEPVQRELCRKIEKAERAALLCFEKKPAMCHRSHLAAAFTRHFTNSIPLQHLHG